MVFGWFFCVYLQPKICISAWNAIQCCLRKLLCIISSALTLILCEKFPPCETLRKGFSPPLKGHFLWLVLSIFHTHTLVCVFS